MSDDTDEAYSLALVFPDQSASFCYGFEAGQLFQRMTQEEQVIDKGFEEDFPLREENLELYQRMAAYKDYAMETGDKTDGWVQIRFTKTVKPKPSLSVVKG